MYTDFILLFRNKSLKAVRETSLQPLRGPWLMGSRAWPPLARPYFSASLPVNQREFTKPRNVDAPSVQGRWKKLRRRFQGILASLHTRLLGRSVSDRVSETEQWRWQSVRQGPMTDEAEQSREKRNTPSGNHRQLWRTNGRTLLRYTAEEKTYGDISEIVVTKQFGTLYVVTDVLNREKTW